VGITITLALVAAAGRVDAGPITFLTALPVAKSQAVVRGQYLFIRASGDPTPANQDLTVNAFPVAVAVGVTSKLALFGVVPVVNKSVDVDMPVGRRTLDATGLGDVVLFARYTVKAVDLTESTFRIAPFGGVKLPTGSDDTSGPLGVLPRPLQPGSGSWDGLGGLAVTWQTKQWEFDADATYRQAGGRAELPRAGSRRTEIHQKLARRAELLNPILLVVGHVHRTVRPDGDADRVAELAAPLAFVAPLAPDAAVRAELNHAQQGIGDVHVAARRHGYPDRTLEPPTLFWLWPRPVSSTAGFAVPTDAVAGPNGAIHVADSANHRVVMLSARGAYLADWRIPDASPDIYSPEHIALSADGSTVYTTDLATDRVLVLSVRMPDEGR